MAAKPVTDFPTVQQLVNFSDGELLRELGGDWVRCWQCRGLSGIDLAGRTARVRALRE